GPMLDAYQGRPIRTVRIRQGELEQHAHVPALGLVTVILLVARLARHPGEADAGGEGREHPAVPGKLDQSCVERHDTEIADRLLAEELDRGAGFPFETQPAELG